MGTFIESSNNVVSERSLWTFTERPQGTLWERCIASFFATFLQRSQITFVERYKLVSKLLSVIVSKHTIDCQSVQVCYMAWEQPRTCACIRTFIERSNNVVSERSLWTFIERTRGTLWGCWIRSFLYRSLIIFLQYHEDKRASILSLGVLHTVLSFFRFVFSVSRLPDYPTSCSVVFLSILFICHCIIIAF